MKINFIDAILIILLYMSIGSLLDYEYSNLWIYSLSKDFFNELVAADSMTLNLFEESFIKKNDVIIIYVKDRLANAFRGIMQASCDCKQNKGLAIFSNKHMNRWCVDISFRSFFTEPIKPITFIEKLNVNDIGYNNPGPFSRKYMKNLDTVCKVDNHQKKIIDTFIKMAGIQVNEIHRNIEQIVFMANNPVVYDLYPEIVFDDSTEETFDMSDNESIIESNEESNDDDGSISGYDDEGSEEEEYEEIEDDPNGYIPILIIPCKDFKFPNTNKDKYFIEHYKTCNKCDITDNNTRGLSSIIDHATVEFYEITDKKHAFFLPTLDSYYALKKFEPFGIEMYPFVRILYINNGHYLYDKCIFVVWCDYQED